jgi:hypothetical protein
MTAGKPCRASNFEFGPANSGIARVLAPRKRRNRISKEALQQEIVIEKRLQDGRRAHAK